MNLVNHIIYLMKRYKWLLGILLAIVMSLTMTSCSTLRYADFSIPSGCGKECFSVGLIIEGSADSVKIDWDDGSPVDTLRETVHTWQEPGTYDIKVTAQRGNETVIQEFQLTVPYDGNKSLSPPVKETK